MSILYLGFRTVMRKEAFFALNRMVLISVVVISFIIPLLYLPSTVKTIIQEQIIPPFSFYGSEEKPITVVENMETTAPASLAVDVQKGKPFPFSTGQIIFFIYLAGMLFSFFVFMHGIASVLIMPGKIKPVRKDGYWLFIIGKDIPAFSFWKMIFISRTDYTEHGFTILAHEQQHIRLGHFYDLMLMETTKMVHWFNPIIYLLIQDLKAIHEYQADQHTLTKGVDATKYQLLIIEKGVGQQRLALANSFNHCQIKKRITMMNKQSTGKAWRWKVATFLPLLALLLMAFGREGKSDPMEITSSQVQASPIIGTWKLVSYNYGGGDELNPASPDAERIKFITEKNFNWVHYAGADRIVTGSAGGTYTLSGDDYTESIEFGGQGMSSYIGKAQKFKVKFENNKMHLSGELSSGLRIKEIWERYQPSDKTSMVAPSSAPQKKDRNHIWLENDGTVRYNSQLTSLDRLAEKVKSDIKGDSKLPLNIFMEEGKIDEHTTKIKNALKGVENLDVIYWSFHQEKETDSNGQVFTKVSTKTIDVK